MAGIRGIRFRFPWEKIPLAAAHFSRESWKGSTAGGVSSRGLAEWAVGEGTGPAAVNRL